MKVEDHPAYRILKRGQVQIQHRIVKIQDDYRLVAELESDVARIDKELEALRERLQREGHE